MTFDPETLTYRIAPTNPITDIGYFYIYLTMSDSNKESSNLFEVNVFNEPPYFFIPLENKRVIVGNNLTYELSSICRDRENLPFKVKARYPPIGPLPSFIKFIETNRVFEFSP